MNNGNIAAESPLGHNENQNGAHYRVPTDNSKLTYSSALTIAGLSTEWLRWSTSVLNGSPAGVVRSCSKAHGMEIASAMYLGIVSFEFRSLDDGVTAQDARGDLLDHIAKGIFTPYIGQYNLFVRLFPRRRRGPVACW